jgi:preprotein translocase subunit SecY
MEKYLALNNLVGMGILMFLTFMFTIAMSIVTFNPYQVADNFKKTSTFIPGIKPGEETEEYLTNIILRLSFFSAIFLSLISSMQYFQEIIGLNKEITFGGTSLIILVTVSLETISQLKARKKTIKISNAKKKAIDNIKNNDVEGLL